MSNDGSHHPKCGMTLIAVSSNICQDYVTGFKKFRKVQGYLTSTRSTAVRIQGRPGSGKSVMVSALVYNFTEQGEKVLYFFYVATDPEKMDTINILRTLLSQSPHMDESLYAAVEPSYTKSGRATADSYVDVYNTFMSALARFTITKLYIVIDALDECQGPESLVHILLDAQAAACGQINLFLTSRPIELSYKFDKELVLAQKYTIRPIRKYVEHRALQMKTLSGLGLRTIVIHQVSDAADGLWLYARLMLGEVQRMPSAASVQRYLQKVPRGLTQLYSQILRTKESTFTEVHLKLAQQIFLWIDMSDFLLDFLSFEYLPYKTMCILFAYANYGEPVFDPVALASELYSPLLGIPDGGSYDGTLKHYEVFFTHHTADQYIRFQRAKCHWC